MFWFPNRGNTAQIHQVRKTHHVNRDDHQSHKQVFSRSRVKPKSTHAINNTRSKNNKIKDTGPPTCIRWDNNQITPPKVYGIYVKTNEMKKTIYTKKMDKFPVTSRKRGNT